jgi:alkaline phosphatase
LLQELEKKNYWVIQDVGELPGLEATDRPVLGFFAPEALPQAHHRGFTSAELTAKALAWLPARSDKGFVLMIEGSQIDWACHQNDTQDLMAELRDFNGAVNAAWTFVQSHPDTLLVVTADHETGAVFLVPGSSPKVEQHVRFSSRDHSGIMLPLLAAGAGSQGFAGVYSNADLGKKLMAVVEPQ